MKNDSEAKRFVTCVKCKSRNQPGVCSGINCGKVKFESMDDGEEVKPTKHSPSPEHVLRSLASLIAGVKTLCDDKGARFGFDYGLRYDCCVCRRRSDCSKFKRKWQKLSAMKILRSSIEAEKSRIRVEERRRKRQAADARREADRERAGLFNQAG